MPCVGNCPVRVNDQSGSGCRRDCLHRADVASYREVKLLADETRKQQREAAGAVYPSERAEWEAQHPAFTFKQWLTDKRREDPR